MTVLLWAAVLVLGVMLGGVPYLRMPLPFKLAWAILLVVLAVVAMRAAS